MKRKFTALFVAILMVVALIPTAALADGPYVHQEFRERVQLTGGARYVTVNSSTTYPTGHQETGGTISDNRWTYLRVQGSWTFTANTKDGYAFDGWTTSGSPAGAYSVAGNQLTVSYVNNSNYDATANFHFVGFTVTLDLGAGGTFNSNGSSTITLTAQPYGTLTVPAYTLNDGYDFTGWNGSLNINSSRTLTANYNYRVNFVGNTNVTITGANPVWTSGHTVTAPTYSVTPGYRFDGWNRSLSGITAPTTITANPAVRQYMLTLEKSGQGSFLNESAVEGLHDAGDEVWLSNALPVGNLGWVFTRWLDPSTGQTYPLLKKVTINSDCTYIAIFESIGSRYVNAYALGPHGKLNHNINGTYAQGTQINLNDAQPTAVTPGYEFKYWEEYIATSDSWIPVALTGGQPIITVGVVNDYRAIFGIDNYSITYDLGGGSVSPANPTTYNIQSGAITLNNPTRNGYTFTGWSGTDIVGTTMSVTIPAGSTGDRSYTANWTADVYSISYDLDGGNDPGNPTSYTIESGDITLNNPTKAGYTFAGWTGTDIAGTSTNVTIPTGSTGDRSYTATWTMDDYSISYDLAGGAVDPANPTTYNIQSGDITLNNPTKDGYTFAGWSGTDIVGTSTSVTIPAGSTGDRAYTANWTAIDYNISYDLQGGAVDPANPASYTIESGDITLNNPTRNGYTFAGWTGTDLAGETLDVTIPAGSTGDRSYTANWTAITYTLSYDLDGGTVDPANPASYTIESGDITLNNPTKDGYTFIGWSETVVPDGAQVLSKSYEMNMTIPTGSTGDRLYTAHYQANLQMFLVNYIVYLDREQTEYYMMSIPFTAYTDDVVDVASFIIPGPGYDITTDPADTLTIGTDPQQNVINIYYTPQEQTYTVHYYLDGTTDQLAPDKTGTGVSYEWIYEEPIDIEGYEPLTEFEEIVLLPPELEEGDNTITFYYSVEVVEPTAPVGPVETTTPAPTVEPTVEPTVTVPEETAPSAPALPVTGENSLDWMLMVGGLVLATGTLLLVSRKRKQGEK